MNNIRTSVVGIDKNIQDIQTSVYELLGNVWSGDVEGYGRVYKNEEGDGYLPEWYNSSNSDYEDVYYNDSKSCVFCFLVSDNDATTDELVFTSNVKCVFMVDLSKIYENNSLRKDSEAQRDATQALRDSDFNSFSITQVQRGIDNVFSGYITEKVKSNIDIQPLHCFSVNFNLQYYLTDKCN